MKWRFNPLVPKTHTFFGDNLKKQVPLTYHYSPTIKTTTNTQLHYLEILGLEAMEIFFGDFASDGSDFDEADGNSYKD